MSPWQEYLRIQNQPIQEERHAHVIATDELDGVHRGLILDLTCIVLLNQHIQPQQLWLEYFHLTNTIAVFKILKETIKLTACLDLLVDLRCHCLEVLAQILYFLENCLLCSYPCSYLVNYLGIQTFILDGIGLLFSIFFKRFFTWYLDLLDLHSFINSPEMPVLVCSILHFDVVDGLDVDSAWVILEFK